MPHDDPDFLVALAAFVHRRYRARASGISGQLDGHGVQGRRAVRRGRARRATASTCTSRSSVTDFHGQTGSSAVAVGEQQLQDRQHGSARQHPRRRHRQRPPFTAQVERGAGKNPLALRVSHNGTQIEAMVLSPLRRASCSTLMPYKAPPDLSKFLMSPMPGLLVEVAVQPGQKVQAGEKLAVIEAMKMENVLFATQDGVVGQIAAAKGESLAVDQVIMEFA